MTDLAPHVAAKTGWGVIGMLAAAQFIMVLDTTVMNVSISQVVADLNTTIVGLQTAITMYTLVMAAFMLIGGKFGDRWGAKRAFWIGLLVYGTGSFLTSVAPNLAVLLIGWSLIEGLGAVLVIPAIAALTAATYQGKQRALCYGILGGVSGASMAAGPLIGGWVTAYYSWRYVFAAETVVVLVLMLFLQIIPAVQARKTKLDTGGAVLSALGLGRIVLGVLQSSQWGWITPSQNVPEINGQPLTPLGLSPTLWLILIGAILLVVFGRRERSGQGSRRRAAARPGPARDPADARRTGRAVVSGVHHPGDVLRAAALPADRAGLRLLEDRGDHPADVGRDVRLRARRARR